jgi:hypothetical protein
MARAMGELEKSSQFSRFDSKLDFYDIRDILARACTDIDDPGFGVDCWLEWKLRPLFAAEKMPNTVNQE